MVFLVAMFGLVWACGYFGISVSTMVRDLHLSSIVVVGSMAVVNFGTSLVQFIVWWGNLCAVSNVGAMFRESSEFILWQSSLYPERNPN